MEQNEDNEGPSLQLKDGDKLMTLAQKKMKGSFWDNFTCRSKSEKYEDAVEVYEQAGQSYKLSKKWNESATAYLKCAELQGDLKQYDTRAGFLMQAANMQSKTNAGIAVGTMNDAVNMYCRDGNISEGARIKTKIAEIYETEQKYELAVKTYQEAFDLYDMDNDHSTVVFGTLSKAADLITTKDCGDLVEAIKIYEKVADKQLENKLTSYTVKETYFKASLSYLLLDDTVGAQYSLSRYGEKDSRFAASKECDFVKNLIAAIDNKSVEEFSEICEEYSSRGALDPWQNTVLNKIKKHLEKSIQYAFSVV